MIDKRRSAAVLALFVATLFTGSALLFLVQPMFAKMVLPLLGGTPAVWATSMVFFQAVLLAGYAYSHWSVARLGVRRQAVVQIVLVLLPILLLPIAVPDGWAPPAEARPVAWLLGLLAVALGLPFFVLSTSAPLLQRWFASTDHPAGKDPYFLYAASNAGSMLALLSYPFLLEPALPLEGQSQLWAAGYVVLAAGTIVCALLVRRIRPAVDGEPVTAEAFIRQDSANPAPPIEEPTGLDNPGLPTQEPAGVSNPGSPVAAAGVESPTAVVAVGGGVETVAAPAASEGSGPVSARPVDFRRRLHWVALAFVPSALMIAVTTYVSTDIAAIPLLWVIPLALYLLTFIFAFGARRTPILWPARAEAITIITIVLVLLVGAEGLPRPMVLGLPLLGLFICSFVCHAELANDRPLPRHLTEFYLWVALGGVLGGIFAALIAPVAFDGPFEYPLSIVLAALVMPALGRQRLSTRKEQFILMIIPAIGIFTTAVLITVGERVLPDVGRLIALTLVLGICALLVTRPRRFGLGLAAVIVGAAVVQPNTGEVLYSERTFFGMQRVLGDEASGFHRLMHGTTLHGIQSTNAEQRTEPLSYYHRETPIGQVLTQLPAAEAPRIGVIGLGTGSLACYSRPQQQWTFFEIDPVMVQIARNPDLFTFLQDCPGRHDVVLGDARLSLADVPDAQFGVLVVDAFNSDAIPVHLLTREAIQLYMEKLAPGGVAALHISNRYLDLRPVLGNVAADLGLTALYGANPQTLDHLRQGKSASHWVLLSRDEADLGGLMTDVRWTRLQGDPAGQVWTDDFSDVFSVFRWRTR